MFRNRRQRHPVRSRQIGNASVTVRQMREDAPARWICQRGERAIQNIWRIFNHLVKHLVGINHNASAKNWVSALQAANRLTCSVAAVSALLRSRALSRCKPLFDRSVLCSRVRRRSLGSPSGFHRSRELRTTFWGQIESSLHFSGGTWSLNSSRLYSNFTSADGRFPLFLSCAGRHCRFKFLFQLGELLRPLLQANFQPADFLAKILRPHMRSILLQPVADATSAGYRVNDKTSPVSRHCFCPSLKVHRMNTPTSARTCRDSDCCFSSLIRSVTWRRLSTQKGNGNGGCSIAAYYLGLSQSGKPRTSVVGPYQI